MRRGGEERGKLKDIKEKGRGGKRVRKGGKKKRKRKDKMKE